MAAGVKLRDLAPAALDRTPSAPSRRGARARAVARDGGAQAGRASARSCATCGGRSCIDDDPAGVVATPKREVRMPAHLSEDEMLHLLAAPRHDDALGRRDRAILELFYASGLRLSELAGLDLQDVNLARQMVRVLGKGGKERLVPFNHAAAAAMRAYLKDRRDARARRVDGAESRPAATAGATAIRCS